MSTGKRNSEIVVMNMGGSVEINLSDNPAYDRWPAWTPDGTPTWQEFYHEVSRKS